MLRRRPSRNRIGHPSYGRRVPACNFAAIREEVRAMNVVVSSIREGSYRIVENHSPKNLLNVKSTDFRSDNSNNNASVLELFPPV